MQFDELRFVCQEAAGDILRSRGRPLPPTIVLPGAERTQLLTLPELPDDDQAIAALTSVGILNGLTPTS